MRFCEIFHSDDTGWRTCKMCKKRVHCGCISSINLFMHLDGGGIECILCARKRGSHISAYFSSNSQSEGVPLRIEDANIQDSMFQFSFWPNNNHSMHVLEGITPCMQPVQSQGDNTVNFSQLKLEENIIMGFRKASNSNAQVGLTSKIGNGASPSKFSDRGINENMSVNTDSSEIVHYPGKRKADSLKEEFICPFNDSDTYSKWYKNNCAGGKSKERQILQSVLLGDKLQSHNLGTKNKRLRIDNEDALELKVTWEKAQNLFCPPLMAVPSVVIIEGHEFEEYEEPPIFGKRMSSPSKRLRAPSSPPCEVSSGDLDKLPEQSIGTKRRNVSDSHSGPVNSCGLDAPANAVALGEKITASSLVSPTTKHPRHRLGCTCIVCIQPPSGMGPKHKPSCTCNVCITVKRRFKTLMMRRRKEAENARKKHNSLNEQKDVNSGERKESDVHSDFENEFVWETPAPFCKEGITKSHDYPGNEVKLPSNLNLDASCKDNEGVKEDYLVSKGRIDLNSQPGSEEEELLEIDREIAVGVLDNYSLPLDMCIKQHELPSLIYPPQISTALGFQQSSSEEIVEETSRVQNEDHIMKGEFISNITENDAKSISI
ncbi:B3 domain-containing transcription repressor VAL2 isoform X2 [Cryptomeria japonica]|nr:B3 domain-containing transcription repressor VAL2 isoform X2 [Cryptomeria japonica]